MRVRPDLLAQLRPDKVLRRFDERRGGQEGEEIADRHGGGGGGGGRRELRGVAEDRGEAVGVAHRGVSGCERVEQGREGEGTRRSAT